MLLRIKTSVSMTALILISITAFNALAYAQVRAAERKGPYIWLNAGLGAGTNGFAAGASISIQHKQLLFSPRATVIAEMLGDSYGDLGVMLGYSSKKPGSYFYYSVSAGGGLVYGPDALTVGVPIDLQLFFTPFRIAGIGLQGFANINSQKSFVGMLLCLQLGKVR